MITVSVEKMDGSSEENISSNMTTDDGGGGGNDSSSNLTGCMQMPVTPQLWSTICEGILSVIVGICGLMGNGASIAVLSRPIFKETFHKLLVCLSVFDSLFIGELCII
jgi:hypothetical protein